MYKQRLENYSKLAKKRSSVLLVYITSDRPGLEAQIASDVFDYFLEHLDKIGVVKKISLFLYTRGGDILAGWSIVNLIRQFCDEFEIIVPSKALSTGTLMCLGANKILMTKQATLGPIDPSVNTPLNPKIEGGAPDARLPVSVESIKGYIELAKNEIGIKEDTSLAQIYLKLSEKVHPLVLGQVYRARSQIQMLANKLIVNQVSDQDKIKKIIAFLCSESGSHDYTINRREALNSLGLVIEKPDDELYTLIKSIYTDLYNELEISNKLDPISHLEGATNKKYEYRRCLLESVEYGSNYFVSEGNYIKKEVEVSPGIKKTTIEDQRTFEGWRYYK